jgi:DNA-binding Xre family transcriptional regulator
MELATMPLRFRLKEILDKQNPPMSQTDLSRKSNVSMTTVNAIVLNKTKQVSFATLESLGAALGVDPREILDFSSDKKRR